jgi:hypothetical protein
VAQKIVANLTQDPADLIEGYGSGAKIYLDSSATQGGVYANVTSEALVAGTTQHEFWDPNGSTTTWYKVRVGRAAPSTATTATRSRPRRSRPTPRLTTSPRRST